MRAKPEPEAEMKRALFGVIVGVFLAPTAGCIPWNLLFPDQVGLVTAADIDTGQDRERLSGRVNNGAYRLFELGPSSAGEEWQVASTDSIFTATSFTVALFDADFDLLRRETVGFGSSLRHTLRYDTPALFVGVAPAYSGGGGDFNFRVSSAAGRSVPGAKLQRVYLNFSGGSGVRVNSRSAVSFGPFRSEELGAVYVDQTPVYMDLITAAVRSDYSEFNVDVFASHEGPPPGGPYATVYFGYDDDGLLGLADNVDQYNEIQQQVAMVYVGAFRTFEYLGLTTEEMAYMVANVASHELGHLLGLYHTKNPLDVMDTTGTVWELTEDQSFIRAELEPSVFPFGYENSPRALEFAVGRRPQGSAKAAPSARIAGFWSKLDRQSALRRTLQTELKHQCGTCAALSDRPARSAN